MTTIYYVGIQSVDRAKREMVVWVMRSYPGFRLPVTYTFFCGVLYGIFRDSGSDRYRFQYEHAGMLEFPPGDLPDGLNYDSKNTEQFVEHVEMIRWSGQVDEVIDQDNDEERYGLQAEYLVRVTDNKYMACRADPCFIGHFYMESAGYDDFKTPTIEMGPWQSTPLRALDSFVVTREQGLALIQHVDEQMSTIELCLLEFPKVLKQDPTCLTPDVYPKLSLEQRKVFLSVLMLSNRKESIFSLLDRGTIFHIFSFFRLQDMTRIKELRDLYLSLECDKNRDMLWQHDEFTCLYFTAIHESSAKYFSIHLLLTRMAKLVEGAEESLLTRLENRDDEVGDEVAQQHADEDRVEVARQQAATIGAQLQRIFHAIDNELLPTMGVSSTDHLFPGYDRTRWMRKRLLAYEQMSIDDFVENIKSIAPSDL
jgi:hypothetical protein